MVALVGVQLKENVADGPVQTVAADDFPYSESPVQMDMGCDNGSAHPSCLVVHIATERVGFPWQLWHLPRP